MHRQLKIRVFADPQPYTDLLASMQTFTRNRDQTTIDELWLLEHHPVFTQGQAGKPEHILNPHHIPVVHSDRGGQITYHGPGQLIAYVLIDLPRKSLSIRQLVTQLELTVIQLLAHYQIKAYAEPKAPGVYIKQQKICSLGLRVKRGCSYHGLALNVDMDLTPFSYINPCGYSGLTLTAVKAFAPEITLQRIRQQFIQTFCQQFDYNSLAVSETVSDRLKLE